MAHLDLSSILVPTDLSPHSEKAIEYAVEMAKRLGTKELHLLYVLETRLTAPYFPDFSAARLSGIMENSRKLANAKLDEYQQRFATDGLPMTLAMAEGLAWEEIVSYAKTHFTDLIIMGAHGHGFVSRVVVGSETGRVLSHAPCPVLVVPERADAK